MESPERETLRTSGVNSPHCVHGVPLPAPLVFTPPRSHEGSEMPANAAEEVSAKNVAAFEDSVVICDEKKRNMEKVEEKKRRMEKLERLSRLHDRLKDLEKRSEDGAISPEEYEVEARMATAEVKAERRKEQQRRRNRSVRIVTGSFPQTTSIIRDLNSCRVEGYFEDVVNFIAMTPRILYSRVLTELNISEEKKWSIDKLYGNISSVLKPE